MTGMAERATTAETLAETLETLDRGRHRTRPVSMSVPEPLIDAVQRLVADGVVSSASAAVTAALTVWLRNQILHLQLEEVFAEHPDLRPTEQEIQQTLSDLGLHRPGHAVA